MAHSKMVARPARAAIARVGGVPAGIRWVRWPAGTATPAARLRDTSGGDTVRSRQYAADVLAGGTGRRRGGRREVPTVTAERGLVVEDSEGRFCGAVVGYEKGAVTLEDRHGRRRVFPLTPAAFLLEGQPVTLVPPAPPARTPWPAGPARTASGSAA